MYLYRVVKIHVIPSFTHCFKHQLIQLESGSKSFFQLPEYITSSSAWNTYVDTHIHITHIKLIRTHLIVDRIPSSTAYTTQGGDSIFHVEKHRISKFLYKTICTPLFVYAPITILHATTHIPWGSIVSFSANITIKIIRAHVALKCSH